MESVACATDFLLLMVKSGKLIKSLGDFRANLY